jgi:glycosyltransferase involved in cell wall biosynthesis
MKRAQTFVLSSQYEGLPNVLIQAMAFGTPVVATDCESGPAEILENGRYGALVPVGDEERLAEAIRTSLRLPRNLDAQRSVIARYGVAQATDRYLALAGFTPSPSAPFHA